MIRVTISGIERLQTALSKWKYVNRLTQRWMQSGAPDEIMQKSFLQNFRYSGRPRWSELAEDTKRQREYEGYDEGPILQRSGSLLDAVTSLKGKVTSSSYYSRIEWGLNQLPSAVRKKFGPNQIGKGKVGQNLPARPMIGFQKADGKQLATSLLQWIIKNVT